MATKKLDKEFQSATEDFIERMSLLVKLRTLEAVHAVLGDVSRDPGPSRGSARRGPGRPRGSARRGPGRPRRAAKGKRVRRSSAQLAQIGARVLSHVRSKAGQRLEEIGRALKTDTGVLKKPIADLLKAKKLRTSGAKRGTRYFVR